MERHAIKVKANKPTDATDLGYVTINTRGGWKSSEEKWYGPVRPSSLYGGGFGFWWRPFEDIVKEIANG